MDEKVKELEEWLESKERIIEGYIDHKLELQAKIEQLRTDLKKLKGDLSLCEVCWQILETDGSCLTCRLEKRVKQLEKEIEGLTAKLKVLKYDCP